MRLLQTWHVSLIINDAQKKNTIIKSNQGPDLFGRPLEDIVGVHDLVHQCYTIDTLHFLKINRAFVALVQELFGERKVVSPRIGREQIAKLIALDVIGGDAQEHGSSGRVQDSVCLSKGF